MMAPYLLLFFLGSLGAATLWLLLPTLGARVNKSLPPGSLGWPVIGEIVSYVTTVRTAKLFKFTQERASRYGAVFKTSLLTGKTVMFTDVEGVKFVLQNEARLFESGYPRSLRNVMGQYAMLFQEGELHRRMQTTIRRFVGSTPLKKHLTAEMEAMTSEKMSSWPKGKEIRLHEYIQETLHEFLMKQIFSLQTGKLADVILREFTTLMSGIISLPWEIPGTPYYNAMKAREKLVNIIAGMVEIRKAYPEVVYKDILQALIDECEGDPKGEDIIIDNALLCIANSDGIPASILTLCIKNLIECPEAFNKIKEENLAILKAKSLEGATLSWNDYMSLEFTHAVYNETLRLASAAQGVTRRSLKEFKYRGYTIPKGWTMLPYFLNLHFDEKVFPQPTKFDPWRWIGNTIPSSHFYPFGGGVRLCPGLELARVQSAVFLHHFVTRFRCEATEADAVVYFPKVMVKGGLPVILRNIDDSM